MKKIKVVFLHNQLVCGGAEQALFDLISLMDKSKFDIRILTMVEGGEWESKFQNAGIPIISLFVRRRRGWAPVYFFRHQLRKLKINYMLRCSPEKLVPSLYPEGIDVLVSYSIWEFDRMGFAENARSIKFIHGDVASNQPFRDSILRIRHLLPEYDSIVCVSQQAYQSFCEITGISENVQMHFNPLNSANVSVLAKEEVVLPEGMPVICAVGRLAKEKGYDRLIRIHRNILDLGIAHRLVIVGDGPEREHLIQVIRETGTQDSVIMTGYQSNPYPYMRKSDFLVCSSYTEGLPVIAMECLSLGIPIVSALPSIGEAFGDEVCGLVTENDDDSLQEGIRKMLEDKEFYCQVKESAVRQSRYFDGNRMVREIEELLWPNEFTE